MKTTHEMTLTKEHLDYSTMCTIGTVSISQNAEGMHVDIQGFEFTDDTSCRQHAARVLAWLRDVVDTACKGEMVVPGGSISVGVD